MKLFRCLLVLLFAVPTYARSEETIQIGAIFTLTGFGAVGGTEELNGLELAREEINLAGGIAGKQIAIILEDGRSDAKTVSSAYKKLASVNTVPVIIGPNWAEFTEIVAPLSDSLKVPTITPTGWKKGLLAKHSYLYSLIPPHTVGVRPLAEALNQKKISKITWIVSQNSFYLSAAESTKSQLSGAINNEWIELLPDTTDFRSVLQKVAMSRHDAIAVFMQEDGGMVPFLRQYRDLHLSVPLFLAFLMYQNNQADLLPVAEGIPTLEFTASGTPEFRKKYFQKFGSAPGGGSARAYDALYIVKKAMIDCGTSREQIQLCLPKTDLVGASGHTRFNSSRENLDETSVSELLIVKGGKFFRVNSELVPTLEFNPMMETQRSK